MKNRNNQNGTQKFSTLLVEYLSDVRIGYVRAPTLVTLRNLEISSIIDDYFQLNTETKYAA